MLTGPPRVNDILFPYPQYAGGGDGRIVWEPDHLYFDGREGRVIRQTRYYGVYKFGYNALPTKDYRKVIAALDLEDPVRLTLTRAKGDPEDVSETELRCALESVVPVSGSGDKAPGVYSLEIKLRTLEWRATRDGVSGQVLYHGFDFSQDTDLMGGVQTTSQQPQAWRTSLPYPKRLAKLKVVEAGDVTVRFYDADEAQIGTDRTETLDAGGSMYLELPEGMREVEVETSGSRPSLYLDEDTFALVMVHDEQEYIQLRAYDTGASWQEHPIDDLTFKGTRYGMPTQVEMPSQAQNYLRAQSASSARVSVDAKQTFLPSQIDGLALWLRPGMGLYQDSGATTPADADGDPVALWQDRSDGQSYDLSQSDDGARPVLRKRGDGSPYVDFDGSSQYLQQASSIVGGSQNRTLFVKGRGKNSSGRRLVSQGHGGRSGGAMLITNELGVRVYGGYRLWADEPFTSRSVLSIILTGDQTSDLSAYLDGALLTPTEDKQQSIDTFSEFFWLGANAGDSSGAVDDYTPGEIESVLLYDRALSDTERQQVEDYLTP